MWAYVYPVLFAAFPPLFLYVKNIGELRFKDIFPVIFFMAAFSLLFILCCEKLFGWDPYRLSSIFCACLVVFYTPWERMKRLASRYWYQYIIKYFFLFIAAAAVFIFPYFFTPLLNIMAVVLTCLLVLAAVLHPSRALGKEGAFLEEEEFSGAGSKYIEEDDRPDIYDIVFDAYMGFDAMKESTGFDNSAFYAELKKREFYVPHKTLSNYNHTAASLPSFLNMDYTQGYLTPEDFSCREFIANNSRYRFMKMVRGRVPRFLKSLGYRYVITGEPLLDNDILSKNADFIDGYADRSSSLIKKGAMVAFLNMTLLGGLFNSSQNMADHAEYILRILKAMPAIASEKSPIFAFLHIWAPHTPYVFNADGSINEKFSTLNDLISEEPESKAAYGGHVRFLNGLILDSINELIVNIKSKGRKAVIIIHSDHGLFKTQDPSGEFDILFAAYGYKINPASVLKERMSLVNVYRYIFNGIFGCQFEILDDRFKRENYFAGDYNEADVTDEIKQHGEINAL